MADEVKLHSPIYSTFEVLVAQHVVEHCHGEELGLFVDQFWLKALQFLVHLINLLCILLRCNGFTGIQKAIVDQTGHRPPSRDHELFWVQVWLWKVLWSFFSGQQQSYSSLVVLYNPLFSHITIQLRNGLLLLYRIRENNTSK